MLIPLACRPPFEGLAERGRLRPAIDGGWRCFEKLRGFAPQSEDHSMASMAPEVNASIQSARCSTGPPALEGRGVESRRDSKLRKGSKYFSSMCTILTIETRQLGHIAQWTRARVSEARSRGFNSLFALTGFHARVPIACNRHWAGLKPAD